MNYELFNELTGYSKDYYKVVMSTLKQMIYDLHLKCDLQRISQEVITKETKYKTYSYKLLSRFDYSFTLNKEIPDNKKIMYSSVIVYLHLKKGYYVSSDILSNYLPNLDNRIFINILEGLKSVIADEIIKNQIQSYEMIPLD